jgi:hypothetical protein
MKSIGFRVVLNNKVDGFDICVKIRKQIAEKNPVEKRKEKKRKGK